MTYIHPKHSVIDRFNSNRTGSLAVEAALVIPIILSIGIVATDITGVVKSSNLASNAFYSFGDTISSTNSEQISCRTLRRIAQLTYQAYLAGNWGNKSGIVAEETKLPRNGSDGFKLRARMLQVQELHEPHVDPSNLKAKVSWSFFRHPDRIAGTGWEPNALVDISEEYQVPGEYYLHLEGSHLQSPIIGYLGIVSEQWTQSDLYFSLRNVPGLDLAGRKNSKCR